MILWTLSLAAAGAALALLGAWIVNRSFQPWGPR